MMMCGVCDVGVSDDDVFEEVLGCGVCVDVVRWCDDECVVWVCVKVSENVVKVV